MPLYSFECDKCKKVVEIIRTMAESDVPPSADEIGEITDCTHDKFTKVILHAPTKQYAFGWKGDRKGGYNNQGGW